MKKREYTFKNAPYLLYVLKAHNTGWYKVGITYNLNKRIKQLQTGCPTELEFITLWKHNHKTVVQRYERILHRYYKKCGFQVETQGEWFTLNETELNRLCQAKTVQQQNNVINEILKIM